MPIVDNADLLDAVQLVASELDSDLSGVGVEGVPDQLDDPRERLSLSEPLQMILR